MRTLSRIRIVLVTFVIMMALPFAVYAVDGQIKIGQTASTTFPIQITQSGSYVLTSNIVVATMDVNGIEINTDNVTLDLNGHSIIGPGKESGSTGTGIMGADNIANITIKDGVIRDFRERGVYFSSARSFQLKDLKVYNNGYTGIAVLATSNIINCISSRNLTGFNVERSNMINCIADYNAGVGISAGDSTVTNCNASGNNDYGISASGSVITNCVANNNGGSGGIYTHESIIKNCMVRYNASNGIRANSRNRILENNIHHNGGYGILLDGPFPQYNYVIKNTASYNTSGNFQDNGSNNYMPICGVDATDNCNYGW